MAYEYFGWPATSGDPSGGGSDGGPDGIATIQQLATEYTCPGSGAYDLISLGMHCAAGGISGEIRMAIYDGDGDLVVQTDKKTLSNNSLHWEEFTNFTWSIGTQLTGGATYRLASVRESTQGLYYRSVSNASKYTGGTTYADDGFPATDAGLQTNSVGVEWALRATVEAAAGGLSIPVAMHHYQNQH